MANPIENNRFDRVPCHPVEEQIRILFLIRATYPTIQIIPLLPMHVQMQKYSQSMSLMMIVFTLLVEVLDSNDLIRKCLAFDVFMNDVAENVPLQKSQLRC